MKTIYKYVLNPYDCTVVMPRSAKILTASEQNGAICLWAEVDPHTQGEQSRHFEVFGTGHNIPLGKRQYISTVFMDDLVFHVYEEYCGRPNIDNAREHTK